MAITKQEQLHAMAIELTRFKDEARWPREYVYVKTWPWITPQVLGTLTKGSFKVVIGPGRVEQFQSYEALVQRWMGD